MNTDLSLILIGLAGLAGLVIGIVEKCKECKDPKPVRTARRSRRQKSGFAMVIDMFEGFDRALNDMAKGTPLTPCYKGRRRKRW